MILVNKSDNDKLLIDVSIRNARGYPDKSG